MGLLTIDTWNNFQEAMIVSRPILVQRNTENKKKFCSMLKNLMPGTFVEKTISDYHNISHELRVYSSVL